MKNLFSARNFCMVWMVISLAACTPAATPAPATLTSAPPTATAEPSATNTDIPTDTPAPTLTDTPEPTATATATVTIEFTPEPISFTYKNQEFNIQGTFVGEKYSQTLKMADPERDDPLAELTDKAQSPDTKSLIVIVTAPITDLAQALTIVMELAKSSITDQDDNKTSQLEEHFSFSMGDEGITARLVFFPSREATDFTLLLPDGQVIPLESVINAP